METWRHVQLCIYLILGISLLFLFGTEAQRSNPDFDSNNLKNNSFCSFKRFIMKSYYEKYGSLLDSDFHAFIAQALPFGLSGTLPDTLNLVPKLSLLHRNLIGEGSHRHLSSSIRFSIDPKSITDLPTHSCEVIIIERLPSGVFADPFELQHLLQRGVFNDVAVFGDTNLELPSFLSSQSVVEIHMDVGPNLLLRHKNGLDINIELPLHARYPPLDESGYSRVKFGPPDLFVCCSIKGTSHNQSCLFTSTSEDAELESGEIVWRIPSGIKTHARIVSVVTFISALLSTLLIVLTCIFYSDARPHKTLKQS
ncbi:phosphatidylinositol-glycan biosynthesis class X protein [Fagus crenata]